MYEPAFKISFKHDVDSQEELIILVSHNPSIAFKLGLQPLRVLD